MAKSRNKKPKAKPSVKVGDLSPAKNPKGGRDFSFTHLVDKSTPTLSSDLGTPKTHK